MKHKRKLWSLLLAVALAAVAVFPSVADGPTMPSTLPTEATAEIIARVDARVAATVARIENKWTAIRVRSLARVEARVLEIYATRRCPVLPPASGTWRGISY